MMMMIMDGCGGRGGEDIFKTLAGSLGWRLVERGEVKEKGLRNLKESFSRSFEKG